MALTEAQSLSKYGTVAYTAWDEASAQADWNAKHGGNVPIPTATPAVNPQPTPPTNPISTPTPTSSGQPGEAQLIQVMMSKGHTEATAKAAIAGRGLTELAKEYGVSLGSSGVSGALQGLTAQPSINLPDLYKSFYESSGISDLEKDLSAKEKEYTEAKGRVNENPFLSEATRVGRIAKLEQLFNERTANLRSDIAKKKADIETQLNLQTKQFDINSQQAQQALSQFNTLLGLGALTNASGEDIANIARSTGLSTTMIENAITKSNQKEIEPMVITETDNAGNVNYAVIDKNTGDVISKQSLGKIGKASTSGGESVVDERQKRQALTDYLAQVASYGSREEAIADLNRYRASIVSAVGEEGYQQIQAEIDRLYPQSGQPATTQTTSGGLLGSIKSFFGSLFGK